MGNGPEHFPPDERHGRRDRPTTGGRSLEPEVQRFNGNCQSALLGLGKLSASRAALVGTAYFIAALLVGCMAVGRFGGSRQAVVDWAAARGFAAADQQAGQFRLLTLSRSDSVGISGSLRVYIEGDGAAWPTPYHPPRDPTPIEPTALALAAADPAIAVVYIGRPCQFLGEAELARCPAKFWTDSRFAPTVIDAYMELLDRLKAVSGAQRVSLVGHSGGGVIAALLAGRRNDVEQLVTVAAPLAVAEWSAFHRVSPLAGSLDPDSVITQMPDAIHLVGAEDDVVPPQLLAGFVRRHGGRLRQIAGFDHRCCWARDWKRLLEVLR